MFRAHTVKLFFLMLVAVSTARAQAHSGDDEFVAVQVRAHPHLFSSIYHEWRPGVDSWEQLVAYYPHLRTPEGNAAAQYARLAKAAAHYGWPSIDYDTLAARGLIAKRFGPFENAAYTMFPDDPNTVEVERDVGRKRYRYVYVWTAQDGWTEGKSEPVDTMQARSIGSAYP